ncbi:MAG TPA: formylglycine-generating enzyme family protein [Bacteroidota bacterium]|nr:formylglycine-generating enzyme family protein [Bacteroidota bacterium]
MRFRYHTLGFAVFSTMLTALAQDSKFPPRDQQIPVPDVRPGGAGPNEPSESARTIHDAWLRDVRHWRTERHIRTGYTGARYDMSALRWTQSSFIQPQMMVQDRYFYDPVAGRYTVDRYLDDLEKRYGGIDAVLIWPTYPNMGIDDRNQLDMIRCMPGGIRGVHRMVSDFHRRGVRVLFPMMMWDQGTADAGRPWPEAIAQIMAEIGADGINGDTQDGVPLAFPAAAERIGHPLAFEPEGGCHDEALAYNLMTWGQYRYPFVPMVDRYKWLEPRHMVNISDRWNKDKTDNLQFAFFNGVGWESWENIWGIWNGITPRDAEATRRVASLERAVAPFLVSRDWEPAFPMLRYGVFASRWPLKGRTVWTIVNRNHYAVEGPQIELPAGGSTRYFDLYHGTELVPERRGDRIVLSFALEPSGYGALLAAEGAPDSALAALMATMHAMTAAPLAGYSHTWVELPQQMAEIPPTPVTLDTPAGMVKIAGGTFVFRSRGIEIEGSNDVGVDVQYPWEDSPRRYHERTMAVGTFWIDRYPVTNAQFRRFLDSSRYRPRDAANFLRDWKNGSYPSGWENRPVTWVSWEDARAYAAWAGKRLPHEWEWQYAAQGTDGRTYPWGDSWDSAAVPAPDTGRTLRGPDPVEAHPKGATPAGVMDLVGNVWQMTDEFLDEHTRAGLLKGGSYYSPQGSMWYFPQAYRLEEHGKLLLMAPCYDRSGTVGFRCVRDAER